MAVPFLSGNPFFCSAAPKLFFINILQKKKNHLHLRHCEPGDQMSF
jgi:hypothetical protein